MESTIGRDPGAAVEDAAPNATLDFEGEHTIEEPIEVATPGLTLRGLDLRLADGADDNLIEVAADGVRVVDFRLDGNRANQPGDRLSNGVVVAGASNVVVEKGVVEDASRHGVLVMETATEKGRSIEGDVVSAPEAAATSDVTVRDVRVESPRRDGCSVEGPAVANVRVEGVRTFDSADRGSVEVKDGASDAVVTNCYAEGCAYGVTIQDHGEYGVENVTVAHNVAVDCDKLVDAQTSLRHADVTVTGNGGRDVSGAETWAGDVGAIYMGRVDGLAVADNRVAGAEHAGIVVEDCTDASVTGNVVRDTDGPGVLVTDTPSALVSGNVARGTEGIVAPDADGRNLR